MNNITSNRSTDPPPPDAVTVAIPPLAVAVTFVLKLIAVIPVPTEVPLFSISIPEIPPLPVAVIVVPSIDKPLPAVR